MGLVVVGALVAGDTPTFSTLDFLADLARSVPASVGCRVCEEKKRACRLVVLRKDSGLFRMGLVVVVALVAGDTPTFSTLDFCQC